MPVRQLHRFASLCGFHRLFVVHVYNPLVPWRVGTPYRLRIDRRHCNLAKCQSRRKIYVCDCVCYGVDGAGSDQIAVSYRRGFYMSDNDLRMRDICTRFSVARWTVYRWIRELGFPAGDMIRGVKGRRWKLADVEAWRTANLLPLNGGKP